MRNDSNLLRYVLTALPPILAGVSAGIVRLKFHPFTFDSEAAFVALCVAGATSGIFALHLIGNSRNDRSQSSWIAGLEIVAEPLAVLEVAACNLAIGWMLGTILGLSHFPQNHVSRTRLLLPCAGAAIAGIILHLQWRPTRIQRIWQLADARNGQVKLEALLHTAQQANDETTVRAIAKMPRMKTALLETLSAHASPAIRADVANNPNTPGDILLTLSRDRAIEVRTAVAFNSAASIELLRELLKDSDEPIRDKALSRMRELEITP